MESGKFTSPLSRCGHAYTNANAKSGRSSLGIPPPLSLNPPARALLTDRAAEASRKRSRPTRDYWGMDPDTSTTSPKQGYENHYLGK